MAKICKYAKNWIQIYNCDGDVRECGWTKDGSFIGNLKENSLPEIYHGEAAEKMRERLVRQDYSQCLVDGCPVLMTGKIDEFQTELGTLSEYPEELYLAFENDCNYRCRSCTVHNLLKGKTKEELERNYDIIEMRVREAMTAASG